MLDALTSKLFEHKGMMIVYEDKGIWRYIHENHKRAMGSEGYGLKNAVSRRISKRLGYYYFAVRNNTRFAPVLGEITESKIRGIHLIFPIDQLSSNVSFIQGNPYQIITSARFSFISIVFFSQPQYA